MEFEAISSGIIRTSEPTSEPLASGPPKMRQIPRWQWCELFLTGALGGPRESRAEMRADSLIPSRRLVLTRSEETCDKWISSAPLADWPWAGSLSSSRAATWALQFLGRLRTLRGASAVLKLCGLFVLCCDSAPSVRRVALSASGLRSAKRGPNAGLAQIPVLHMGVKLSRSRRGTAKGRVEERV